MTRARARVAPQGAQQLFAFEKKRKRSRHWGKPGPKPAPERAGFLPHRKRPEHDESHPVLVTARCVANLPSLRSQILVRAITAQLGRGIRRGIRVVQYSMQDNHLHMIVEADDRTKLARGMQWLLSRIAFEVNRLALRSGRVFRDRNHRQAIINPTQMRRALAYVLLDWRKHRLQKGDPIFHVIDRIDECSSASWFQGWSPDFAPPSDLLARVRAGPCVRPATPKTWLARGGWTRGGGPIRFDELLRP